MLNMAFSAGMRWRPSQPPLDNAFLPTAHSAVFLSCRHVCRLGLPGRVLVHGAFHLHRRVHAIYLTRRDASTTLRIANATPSTVRRVWFPFHSSTPSPRDGDLYPSTPTFSLSAPLSTIPSRVRTRLSKLPQLPQARLVATQVAHPPGIPFQDVIMRRRRPQKVKPDPSRLGTLPNLLPIPGNATRHQVMKPSLHQTSPSSLLYRVAAGNTHQSFSRTR